MIKNGLYILVFLFSSSVFGQSGGLNFSLGFPSGNFKENMKKTGLGISGQFNFLSPTETMPVGIGFNAGFFTYGNEHRREPFSTTIPDVTVDVDRTHNLVNFHLVFTVGVGKGPFRHYAEGLFGGNYLFTETKITSRGGSSNEVASNTNFDDISWSYGGGGGFMIEVYSRPEEQFSSIFIDVKGRYLMGSKAKYLQEGSVVINSGKVTYNFSESKTDLITAHIGVVATFNSLFR
jgi:hypothetical protein